MRFRRFSGLLLLPALALVSACDKATPVAPVGATITLSVNPTRIDADGVATVTALVRRMSGAPVNPGTEILFSTTLGRVTPEVVATDDRGLAETTLFGNDELGTAMVTARSGAADAVGDIAVQIGALVFGLEIEATPDSLPKSGGEIELIATATDDLGRLLDDIAVTFGSDAGTLAVRGPVFTNEPCPGAAASTARHGVACNSVTVTAQDINALADVLFEVRASAATDGGSLLEDVADVRIRGVISMVELQATPSTIPEAGGSIQLAAVVLDDDGDPVEDANVIFGTEVGSLASRGTIVPTNVGGEAFDTLTVTEADLSTVGTITFQVMARTTAFDGTEVSDTFNVRIERAAPVASFTFSVNGLEVTFTNTSTGEEPLTFEWGFGDGTMSTSRNPPPKTYAVAGTYQVTLTATNTIGSDTTSRMVTVSSP